MRIKDFSVHLCRKNQIWKSVQCILIFICETFLFAKSRADTTGHEELEAKKEGNNALAYRLLSQCVPLFLFFLALFWKLTTSPEATSTTYARLLL
uniref:Uncharacterized protein n=1 Tax=Oryza brachyantha TaxID=4533 RepID=J3LCM1_ORYBR